MKGIGLLRTGMIVVACLGMLIPPSALQAATGDASSQQPTANRAITADLALGGDGSLRGQAVNAQGKPVPLTRVSLRQNDREVATTTTDRNGHFLLPGLRGGTYQLVAGQASVTYRLWQAKMAPPSATRAALVVVDGRQVLAQHGPLGYWLSNPWVVAGLVAAAVAIPVAIHNHQVDNGPSTP
jgi:carboxypeptidase family protein